MSERRLRAVVFFAALLACALVTKAHADSWNDRSRFATIESLVNRHTFAIDGSPFTANMKDEYRFGGRTYSDKPPLLAILGAGVAGLLGLAGVTFERTPGAAVYLVTLGVIGSFFALGVTYAYALQRALGFARPLALRAAALTGFGTLAFPYATVFANHVPAGAAALAAFVHARRAALAERSGLRRRDAALAGFFMALAIGCDAGAVPFLLALVVLWWGAPRVVGAVALATAAPLVAAQLGFNHAVSGGFVPPAINPRSWADPASPFHNDYTALGRFPSPLDYLRYAWYVLGGDKGLFSYSPLFLVAVAGLVRWWRIGQEARRMAFAVALPCLAYVTLIVLYTDDFTSYTYGDRRFAEIAFVLCIPLAAALAAASRSRPVAAAAATLGAASMALAALGTFAPFGGPEGIVTAWDAFISIVRRAHVLGSLEVLGLAAAIFAVFAQPRSRVADADFTVP